MRQAWALLGRWRQGEAGPGIFARAVLVLLLLMSAGAILGRRLLDGHAVAIDLAVLALLAAIGAFLLHRIIVPTFHRLERMERRLSESLRHTELLLQNAGEGIYGIDRDGNTVFVNRAAERMLGYDAAELIGRQAHELFHHRHVDGSHFPVEFCPVHQAMCTGIVTRRDHDAFWRKDGHRVDVEYVAAPVLEGGQVKGAVVLFDDITERLCLERQRLMVEQHLRESEANLERAQAQASLGSWYLDIGNNVLEWSRETHRIFEVPTGQTMTYELFLSRVHPDDRAYVDACWQAAMRGETYDIQHRLLIGDRVKWVRERAELEFHPDGRPRRGVGTTQDITELKLKEEELLRSRQMVRELAAHSERIREVERSRIAREIHDELGQYLTALRMDVAMLNIRHGQNSPELADQVRTMKETIDATIGVVRHVASALRPAALDMGLVPAAEWLLANFRERTGVHCQLDVPAGELELDDDRTTAVFRILQESLTNIARHAHASHVRIALEQDAGDLVVRVEDDGEGFDPSLVRHKKTFGLMGIRERAIVFGGESRLDSRPGGGTTLTVRIPQENFPSP